jgi:hypothetical protein
VISIKDFPLLLRSCTFYENLTAFIWRFSDFLPLEKPCPFTLPNGLDRGGTSCSLGSFDLSGFAHSVEPGKRRLPFFIALTFFFPTDLTVSKNWNPRGCSINGLASPSEKGAGLSGLFHQLSSATSLKDDHSAGYFFTSKPRVSSQNL